MDVGSVGEEHAEVDARLEAEFHPHAIGEFFDDVGLNAKPFEQIDGNLARRHRRYDEIPGIGHPV